MCVPEKVFRPKVENHTVTKYLTKQLTVNVKASKITIDGKTLGYFNNQKMAEKVLREIKLQYTNEKTLVRLAQEANEKDKDKIPELEDTNKKKKEDKIFKVSFDGTVQIEPATITTDELMKVKDGVTSFNKGTIIEKKHEVEKGETIETIARNYEFPKETLYKLNPVLNKADNIKPGQTLSIKTNEPYAYVVIQERVTREELIPYKTVVKEDNTMPKGEVELKQSGVKGKKRVQYATTKVNGEVIQEKALYEKTLIKPTTEIKIKGTMPTPSRGTGSFQWPTVGGYVSSKMGQRWGSLHKGIDIARPANRSILAADNGRVIAAGWDSGGYGNQIVINHNNGFRTVYAHLSSLRVSQGDTVRRGQKIGIMGSTGNSTGIHLHFEVYKSGSVRNPLKYVNR